MTGAYYNERDKHCAGWLRNLCAAGLICPGDVDDRDIRDVLPADLDGYTQVHLFAGIGLWSHALRMAGWSDDRPIWTCSCPCQPFSQAGSGAGIFDDRHLWPAAHWLIAQHRPRSIIGEQVASPDGLAWLDIVSSDLEALRYACGALDIPSAGVGSPNIRQRLWWVADAEHAERGALDVHRKNGRDGTDAGRTQAHGQPGARGQIRGLADAANARCGGREDAGTDSGDASANRGRSSQPERDRETGGLADADSDRASQQPGNNGEATGISEAERESEQRAVVSERGCVARGMGDAGNARLPDAEPSDLCGARGRGEGGATEQSGGALHPWREPEWVACTDGTRRPFESGAFPLAARHPGDVAKLRAYGNAINPWVAAQVIRAWLDCMNGGT